MAWRDTVQGPLPCAAIEAAGQGRRRGPRKLCESLGELVVSHGNDRR